MLRLLQLLIFGHYHTYEVYDEINVKIDDGTSYYQYVCRCSNCGHIKIFNSKK